MAENIDDLFKKEQERMIEGLKNLNEMLKQRIEEAGGEEKFTEIMNENLRKGAEEAQKKIKAYHEDIEKASKVSDETLYRRFDF